MEAAGFRYRGKQGRTERKSGLIETEEPDFAADQGGRGVLSEGGHDHLLVINALPD